MKIFTKLSFEFKKVYPINYINIENIIVKIDDEQLKEAIDYTFSNHKFTLLSDKVGTLIIEKENSVQNFYLYQTEKGSYITYTGTNGCKGNLCSGENANNGSNSTIGFCSDYKYPYKVTGWRVVYISGKNAYVSSAGAPECMCGASGATFLESGCNSNVSSQEIPLFISELNTRALKYCNPNFIDSGVCSNANTWNINANDFEAITGKTITNCLNKKNDSTCGYGNDLIDNGSYYWFSERESANSQNVVRWYAPQQQVTTRFTRYNYGVRPILKFSSTVRVIGGTGTSVDPYIIAN